MPTSVQEKRQPFSKGIIRFFWNIVVTEASKFSAFFSRVVCGYHHICDVALTHGLVPCIVFPAGFEPALNAV